jgi:hypothetical protein
MSSGGQDAGEIIVGGDGAVMVAAPGVTAPTNATSSLGTGWVDLGFISDDGFTWNNDRTITPINVWQSPYPARRIVTARDTTVAFALRQWNTASVRFAMGGGDWTGTAPNFEYTPPEADELDERQLCIDFQDGTRSFRLYFPSGIVTESTSASFNRTAAADLPVTFGATPQAGVFAFHFYAADAAFSGYS